MARRLAVSVVALLMMGTFTPAPAEAYSVGVAAVDITPNFPVRLSGFGFRRTESEGVTQPIWAKALAIGDNEPAVLLAVDNLAIPAYMVEDLAGRLKKAGVMPERLAVTATHTHTAPMLTNVCPTLFGVPIPPEHQRHIDTYTRELADNLEKVARAALKDRAPAQLTWGIGTVKFAANRRTKGGPVDHDLPILVVKDPKGKLRAVYVSYACHCVTLSNNKISGDWAGFAADAIQRAHPEAIALLSVGCGADSNPSSGVTGDKEAVAAAQGAEIAREVDRLLKGKLTPVTGNLATRVSRISLDFDTLPTRAEWEERAKGNNAIGYHAKVQLAKLDRGEKLQEKLPYSVQTWAFGDSLAMVFLPGEVVVDYSLRLKKELDPARLWVNAYANDEPCYIPSERVLKEGGYEGGGAMVYYDRPTRFKAGLEEKIIKAVHEQLDSSFKPRFDPKKLHGTRPLSPQQSQAAIKLKDGFVAELVAAEPLVQSPIVINWGPDGRLWVAEMYDYPTGLDGQFKPGGRIKVLEDTDGDGIYDQATVFLDNIPFPTGVTPWRKGVLICAAPDILYAEDTDGDGKADVVKKLFSGWATHNYQARVNGLEYGLDGWVYGSGGIFGGDITSFSNPKPVPLTNRDFRINPDTGVIEAAAGRSQHGRVRNDWGDWFGCDNSTFLRHYPLADHYLRRNLHVAAPNNDVIITDYPEWNRCYPLRDSIQLFKLSGPPGRATAACGVGVYRDNLLGNEYTGNTFTCEPVNLLVHRLVLTPKGSTFSARRAPDEEHSEFLASTDNWFRPVQARTGPDGALYIVDMYRLVIEHPRWIPPEELAQVDIRAGYNMGRIYRVYHKDRPPRPIKRLDKLDAAELVAALDSPNGPQRDMAMQMLLWNEDKAALPALVSLLKSDRAEARLHALIVLAEMRAISPELVLSLLNDPQPGVRRQTVRVAESLLVRSPQLKKALTSLTSETDPQACLQLAYTLGLFDGQSAAEALARLAKRATTDEYLLAAVISSVRPETVDLVLREVMVQQEDNERFQQLADKLVTVAAAIGDANTVDRVAYQLGRKEKDKPVAWKLYAAATLLDGLDRRTKPLDDPSGTRRRLFGDLRMQAREVLESNEDHDALRMAAMRLTGRAAHEGESDVSLLGKHLVPRFSASVQSSAVTALGRIGEEAAATTLLGEWKSYSPALRAAVLDTLLSRDAWATKLMASLEKGDVSPSDLDAARRQRFLQHKDKAIRDLAVKLFAGTVNPDRKKILDEYQSAASMRGDKARGKDIFAKRCATCHKLDGVGHEVGPDLGQMANKSPAAFLIAILDPNQAVDPRYIQYLAVNKDGRQTNGILAGETATSITLREQDGKETVILRTDLEALESTGKSLMPEGLEKDINKREMADLIAYLSAASPRAQQAVATHQPALIKPPADSSLRLSASGCEIHGGEITFEPEFRNIGMWHGEKDHVIWTVELDKPGSYDVYLDWACDDTSAGNILILEVGGKRLRHRVAGTGAGWSNYRLAKIGTLTLRDGKQQIMARPESQPQRALCDLRTIILVKEGAAEPKIENTTPPQQPQTIEDIARAILDDARSAEERGRLITDHPDKPAEILAAMVRDLKPGTKEEYRRIPWIWRVAIAAGKRNDTTQIRKILELCVPKRNDELLHWQAVVIGGGIINGLTQVNVWPRDRLLEIVGDDKSLLDRLNRSTHKASHMAHDKKVPTGTRYDALRMMGLAKWDERGDELVKFQAKGMDDEIQMGAVSGLGDMRAPEATAALISGLAHYSRQNRELALDALLRDADRMKALLDAVAAGKIAADQIGDKRVRALKDHRDPAVRKRAREILPR